jgi:hypothetical protein
MKIFELFDEDKVRFAWADGKCSGGIVAAG